MVLKKEKIADEIRKCGKDPAYFIRNYIKIRHPQRGLISFELFDYQEELLSDYLHHRFNVILKARQLGISEVTSAFATWMALFRSQKNIIIMATKLTTAQNMLRKVHVAIKNLPEWLLLTQLTIENKTSLEFSNGSVIKAITSSDDAGRSEAVSLFIIDEAAHIANLDTLWTGIYSTVAAGGQITVLSTPKGKAGIFYQLYTDSVNKENDFKATKLMWWRHPERAVGLKDDPDRPGQKISPWFKKEIKAANMSQRAIAQELLCDFLASGDTVISAEDLEFIEKNFLLAPISRGHTDQNLFTWFEPAKTDKYLVGCDVARGDGRDYSAIEVFKITQDKLEQVAEYYGKIPPDQFAQLCVDVSNKYNNAVLVIESNAVGMACLEHVRIKGYNKLYFSKRGNSSSEPGKVIDTSYWSPTWDQNVVPGFPTSQHNRPLLIQKFEEHIRNQQIVIRSTRLVEEMRTFIWVNGRAEAMKGQNDDLVMAACISCFVKDFFFSAEMLTEEMQAAMRNNISNETISLSQVAGGSTNPYLCPQSALQPFGVEGVVKPWEIRVESSGEVLDFGWVIDGYISKG